MSVHPRPNNFESYRANNAGGRIPQDYALSDLAMPTITKLPTTSMLGARRLAGILKHMVGQTQLSEFFGPDCSRRRCPSGDDPLTGDDEEDCYHINQAGGLTTELGSIGNKCHIDCANRGTCDYDTGICKCYEGFYGSNCALLYKDF